MMIREPRVVWTEHVSEEGFVFRHSDRLLTDFPAETANRYSNRQNAAKIWDFPDGFTPTVWFAAFYSVAGCVSRAVRRRRCCARDGRIAFARFRIRSVSRLLAYVGGALVGHSAAGWSDGGGRALSQYGGEN